MKNFFDKLYIQTKRKSLFQSKIFLPSSSRRRVLPQLKLTLHFTQNNIFLSVYDLASKKVLINKSSGGVGFKGRLQKSKNAIYQLIRVIRKTPRLFAFSNLIVEINGHSWLKNFFIRRLFFFLLRSKKKLRARLKRKKLPVVSFLYLVALKVNHLTPFNGCRRRKPRN